MFFGHLPVKEFPQHIQLFTSILSSDNELTLGEYSVAKFEDLAVWQRAYRLCADIYKATIHVKDFGFQDQITRAGLSIPSNIAEGYERDSPKEKANFLKFAKGSTGEIRPQIYIGWK